MILDTFEQSLLTELRQHVEAGAPARVAASVTTRRRRTAGLTVGGLAAAAGIAVAFTLGTGVVGPSAAYAVESQSDGDLVVTVRDLSDASGLEQALAAKGVRADITYDPGFTQDAGQSRSASGSGGAACVIALAKVDGALRFTLAAAQIAAGGELDIVTSGSSAADVGSPVSVSWSGGRC